MASDLPLKRISATVRFFRGVAAVRRQLAAADGLVDYTLRAKPLAPRPPPGDPPGRATSFALGQAASYLAVRTA